MPCYGFPPCAYVHDDSLVCAHWLRQRSRTGSTNPLRLESFLSFDESLFSAARITTERLSGAHAYCSASCGIPRLSILTGAFLERRCRVSSKTVIEDQLSSAAPRDFRSVSCKECCACMHLRDVLSEFITTVSSRARPYVPIRNPLSCGSTCAVR